MRFELIGTQNAVTSLVLRGIERLVGGLEGIARTFACVHFGDTCGKRDLAEGYVGRTIDQPPGREPFARVWSRYWYEGRWGPKGTVLDEAEWLDRDDCFGGRGQGSTRVRRWPTSKAHISVVFHSFWLIFRRVIISRNGLEA